MKKIILHLGLPKTASTTLQHHLFQKLHEDKKINFLGKVIDFEKDTGKPIFRNNTGGIIRNACEEKIDKNITDELDELLSDDLINVYSDEGIMVYYPGLKNLSLEEKLSNLKIILKDYDVKVMLSLRNPIDYFYSLYVQLFPEFYYYDEEKNTFEKYINSYLSDSENISYESFHYPKVLEMIFSKFDTKVILYEDLKKDVQNYYTELANLLELDVLEIENYLGDKHENKKKKKSTGMYSGVYKSISPVNYIISLLPKNTSFYKGAKYIYNLEFLKLKKLFRDRVTSYDEVFHEKPNTIQIDMLSKILLLKDDFDFDKYNLNKEKLKKYKYTNIDIIK